MKKFLMSCCFLVLGITRTLSVTISTAGMQRKSLEDSCVFQWIVNGNFTTYTIQSLSTGSPTALRPNTNHTFDGNRNVIKLLIWNIQLADAGYYSLSISTGPSTAVTSDVLLFVYALPSASVTVPVGRNPAYEGDTVELYCSATSKSLPAVYRPKMYYFWYTELNGFLRNISNGPAVLQNGDVLPGFSINNDGKSLVIAPARYTDENIRCYCEEEGSPYKPFSVFNLQVYSRPYTYNFYPTNRIFNVAPSSYEYVFCYFFFISNPPLTSYTNWSFTDASGGTNEFPVLIRYREVEFGFYFYLWKFYGNCSVTLSNIYGSKTETCQVLPPGPPDEPSNFTVQYMTHSLVSLQWRCMWFNGEAQALFVRIMDVANNEEVETQIVSLETTCYNSPGSTLFQNNIQPETDYEANIWSTNILGSSNVVTLAVRTAKRFIFDTSPANISIVESQATINIRIADSTEATMLLNVTCCVEITTQCRNKTYIIANTDNQIVFDILPTGDEYAIDFIVCANEGYTCLYPLAIVKGLRVSRTQGPPYVPSNFNVQYVTHSLVSLQWRCMWFNGYQQTVTIRLVDVANDVEVETQSVTLATNCNNSAYTTLFQNNIKPETNYEASIWSTNTLGSSNIVKLLGVRTPKKLIFDTSSDNITIVGTQATIKFRIADSAKYTLWLNVTCCVELPDQCNYKSYSINNTDNEIVYDTLPTGSAYVFDFNVYDSDVHNYMYPTAIVKGVRVSREQDQTTEKPNQDIGLLVAVIVLAIFLGFDLLGLIGCFIAFLVCRSRQTPQQNNVRQPPPPAGVKWSSNAEGRDTAPDECERDSNYERIPHPPIANNGYTPLALPARLRLIVTEGDST